MLLSRAQYALRTCGVHALWTVCATPLGSQTWPSVVSLEAPLHPLPPDMTRDGG